MKTINILAALLFTNTLFAKHVEILTCHLTEPFITYKFNPVKKTLTQSYYGGDGPTTQTLSENAFFQSMQEEDKDGELQSKYRVVDQKTGKVFINLTLDNNGSDGMSEYDYPYSAKIGPHHGGCESSSAPARRIYQSVYGLKNK